MSDVLFSVIVPVYNVENYLRECMDSFLSQTFKNYEVLLIDDGSTDSSGRICDEYGNTYQNVKVIHQPNSGLSVARNSGISYAAGEYLLFVDSDDVIEVNALECFANILSKNKADIVTAKAYTMLEDGTIMPKMSREYRSDECINGAVYAENAIRCKAFSPCAPFSVYAKTFIVSNNLKFKPGIRHEDVLWTPQTFYLASTVICGDFFFYYHRVRNGSITHSSMDATIKGAKDLLLTCEELYRFANEFPVNTTKYLRDYVSMIYMSATYIGRLYDDRKVKIRRFFPLCNAYSRRQRIKAFLFCLSPSIYCKVNAYHKKR